MARYVSIAIATGALLAGATAHAQVCHTMTDGGDHDADPVTGRAGVEADVAQIASGSYAGITPSIAVAWWRLEARVATPYYHLEYRGVKSDGPGDLLASLSGALIARDHVRAGAAIAFTEPSGDAQVGLGMGQPMYMPGGWASWSDDAWSALASASYGWMATPPGGHHHAVAVGSLVSPMNHEELEGALRVMRHAARDLDVYAGASVASPVGEGTTRAFAATGARIALGTVELTVEAALPIAGDPFHGRMAIAIGRGF